ncbi:class I SAM-dependent methyltransferase|uniref:class I SAM-dependent methyltransferase n=1 Tax=Noviherbaspirillum sp. L7-7A TaxID=2850560 RepID=UPI001C2C5762|nr:class I SAM-dependent methyltransferase [Noviherbaspirillum sp. L7-7A]MBV0879285.1 class I SAM-dependent methyltransferase [Noviherbaspirillum sp. L7-7A]
MNPGIPLDNLSAETPEYTVNWFASARPVWDTLLPHLDARLVLEIGSYEGTSACYMIDVLGRKAPLEIHCIDHWNGGAEHRVADVDMNQVEQRFRRNTAISVSNSPFPVQLHIHKGNSESCLGALLSHQPKPQFDFIYVDGSHQAADVLLDASMAFRLLRVGGIMVLDDYLWHETPAGIRDPLAVPKMAIDAIINCHFNRLRIISAPLYQIFLQKLAD